MGERRGALRTLSFLALPIVLPMLLSACASPGGQASVNLSRGPNATSAGLYKSGTMKPYAVRGHTYYPQVPDAGYSETGLASWYGNESGTRTANGEVYDADGLSAAHRTFPLPSIAEVTNLDNGKTIRLRINDRGPFNDRIIDLSRGAAKALGVYQTGTARVRVTWLGPADSDDDASAVASASPPTTSDDDDNNAGYIVQIGAFSSKDNALQAQAQIDDARIDTRGNLYIVYLGPFQGAASAESHRQQAIDAGFRDAILKHGG